MLDFTRSGNGARHRRMRNHELQKKLRPRGTSDFLCIIRDWLTTRFTQKSRLSKRPIDQNCNLSFLSERKDPTLRRPLAERIIDLDEVEIFHFKNLLELAIRAFRIM